MNGPIRERSRIHTNIVDKALPSEHVASNMNELALERSRIHASIAKGASSSHQGASDMNELTLITPKRRPRRLQTVQTVQTVQTEYSFLTLGLLFSVVQNNVQYVLIFKCKNKNKKKGTKSLRSVQSASSLVCSLHGLRFGMTELTQ